MDSIEEVIHVSAITGTSINSCVTTESLNGCDITLKNVCVQGLVQKSLLSLISIMSI